MDYVFILFVVGCLGATMLINSHIDSGYFSLQDRIDFCRSNGYENESDESRDCYTYCCLNGTDKRIFYVGSSGLAFE
jgi:hypothetical protein